MAHSKKKKKKRKHTKKQENVTHSQKRKRAMESEYEKVQTSNLSYRELAGKKKKRSMINMLKAVCVKR